MSGIVEEAYQKSVEFLKKHIKPGGLQAAEGGYPPSLWTRDAIITSFGRHFLKSLLQEHKD